MVTQLLLNVTHDLNNFNSVLQLPGSWSISGRKHHQAVTSLARSQDFDGPPSSSTPLFMLHSLQPNCHLSSSRRILKLLLSLLAYYSAPHKHKSAIRDKEIAISISIHEEGVELEEKVRHEIMACCTFDSHY